MLRWTSLKMNPRWRTPVFSAIMLFPVSTLLFSQATAQVSKLPALDSSSPAATPAASQATSQANSNSASTGRTSSTATSQPQPTSNSATGGSTSNTDSNAKATTSASDSTAASGSATSGATTLPGLTSSGASSGLGSLITDLPKLPGADYPAPAVPLTANAPFMQKSNLPEGTVFICVGAALGFIALVVLAWRGLVAWSLHRSVRRAALAHSPKYSLGGRDNKKGTRRKPPVPFYSPGPGSTLSLDRLAVNSKRGSKVNPAQGSLFFSPTAGSGMHTPGNRGSGYLPAGYYAAGSAAPGGGSGMTHIGGGGSISLSNLGPKSHRYSRARSVGPSPPVSPGLAPSRTGDTAYGRPSTAGLSTYASTSDLNLSVPPQGRAPSAYLEDLFENHTPAEFQEDANPSRRL